MFLIVSFLLSIMTLSGLVAFFNLKNIEISIIKSQDIFALKPAKLKIKAKNKYFFGLFLLRIKALQNEIVIPYLKGEGIFPINLIFPERGKYILEKLIISSYFPFYFFRRSTNIPVNFEITVFPHPLKCDLSFLTLEGKTLKESSISRGTSYDGEVTGVRTYVQGDPLRYIHWKATAKTSSLKTKEFSPLQGNPIIISLNDFHGSVEERISKTAYALIEFSKMGNPIGLKIGEDFYPPDTGQSHLRRMLYALAIYNPE